MHVRIDDCIYAQLCTQLGATLLLVGLLSALDVIEGLLNVISNEIL
jgi:hypothetical protein